MEVKYTPWEVYNNMQELIKYRNAVTTHTFMTKDKFISDINAKDYVVIYCKTKESKYTGDNLVIIIIAPGGGAAEKTQEFNKMFNFATKDIIKTKPEILIITEKPLTNFIQKRITEIRNENHDNLPFIHNHLYRIFIIVIFKHEGVPHQTIATESEITLFEKFTHNNRNNFPRIHITDPVVVWLGAKIGDVILSIRPSETTCSMARFLIVIGH